MKSLKSLIESHTIVVLNKALKHGFTQLPNYVLKDKKLSFGARLAYAVLLSYAWQQDSCFPGQSRMAQDLGTTDRSIRTFLTELKDRRYITWKQQGLNKPNIYFILDFKPLEMKGDRKPASGQERNDIAEQERNRLSD